MVVTDPSIDPITGLPVLNPSGPVQQIPLGQEVFPYADLNATAQPTRGPIYGDDIIPTSSLITAPDFQMKPRSVQATTTRELRVREAVFQNLGAAIPDGTTAPVDVNVVSGGGGGGGNTPIQTLTYNDNWTVGAPGTDIMLTFPTLSVVYSINVQAYPDAGNPANLTRNWYVALRRSGTTSPYWELCAGQYSTDASSNPADPASSVVHLQLVPPKKPPLSIGPGPYDLVFESAMPNWIVWYSIDYAA